jgi:hypothetical protein
MYCSGGHLGFPIGIKNIKFVEDHPMMYEIQNGGYCRTYFNIGPYGENVSKTLLL